jgi:hypothetical protein
MVRPENWIRPVGASPTRVIVGAPGSRPRFVVERRRAERGSKSLFGGSSVRAVVPPGTSPAASSLYPKAALTMRRSPSVSLCGKIARTD